ncbi:uncharacterized protein METZ01_LOCUS343169 [marine metagenome]|uniref:Uncharacterized protein n=1 Tax=marine metagenome TaxID=408172 RepID=A0A382QZM8_9ZZZZ
MSEPGEAGELGIIAEFMLDPEQAVEFRGSFTTAP